MRHTALTRVIVTFVAAATLAGAFGCSNSTLQPLAIPDTSTEGGAGGMSSGTGGATVTEGGGTSSPGGASTGGATAVVCLATETKCDGVCADLLSDAANCGACGSACTPTQVCSAGQCACPAENPDVCGARCVNLQKTTTDCGECYHGCSPLRCIEGACGCRDTDITCKVNNTDSCFDPMTDSTHCGNCETACPTNYDCIQGECALSCANHKLTDCSTGVCIDTTKDVNNCGACGTVCPNPAAITCKNSQCVCGNPIATRCGELCVDVSNDTRYCGNCDTKCKAGEICSSGVCMCSPTSITCSGVCTDPTGDSNHCGDCNTVCGSTFHCASSACVCNTGLTFCSGKCPDTQTDPKNCGGCGAACGAGQSCTAGKCECDTGMSKCGSICVDEQTDSAHCGDCTTTCSASQTCIGGQCACGDGLLACGQACVDAQNDAQNCGACGKTCTATQMCQGGKCITSVVQVKSQNQADATQQGQLYVNLNICNVSTAALNLAGYSLKYWYTEDGASVAQLVSIDFTAYAGVTGSAVLLDLSAARVKATSVLTVKFGTTSPALAAGACTGTIQIRVYAQNYVCCYGPQAGDYSYGGTTLAANQNITAYNAQGLLIWGLEPAPAPL
jgi:hypothetical protein